MAYDVYFKKVFFPTRMTKLYLSLFIGEEKKIIATREAVLFSNTVDCCIMGNKSRRIIVASVILMLFLKPLLHQSEKRKGKIKIQYYM